MHEYEEKNIVKRTTDNFLIDSKGDSKEFHPVKMMYSVRASLDFDHLPKQEKIYFIFLRKQETSGSLKYKQRVSQWFNIPALGSRNYIHRTMKKGKKEL